MIFGVGVDLVDVNRLAKIVVRLPNFVKRVFHEAEQTNSEHMAACFAAKEAWLKAMGLGIFAVPLTDVFVVSDRKGRPHLRLKRKARTLAKQKCIKAKCHLSLSHMNGQALAFVVIEN